MKKARRAKLGPLLVNMVSHLPFYGRGIVHKYTRLDNVYRWALKRTVPRKGIFETKVEGFNIIHHAAPIFFLFDEQGTASLFKTLIHEGMIVVDIGAHLGYFTILASKLTGEEGRVYAFEPEPSNFSLLLEHMELNGCKNVVPSRIAICDKVGTAPLYLSSESGEHSLFVKRECYLNVETTTLDRFFEEQKQGCKVDFIKMDIEGSEMKALAGMEKILKENPALIFIVEFEPKWLLASGCQPEEFIGRLYEQGFTIYRIIEKSPPEIIPFREGQWSWRMKRTVSHNLLCVKGHHKTELENARTRKRDSGVVGENLSETSISRK